MSKKEVYILQKFIAFPFGDPINALCLANNHLVMGSMLGRIIIYDIKNKKTHLLSEQSSEEISDISYNKNENCFYIAIGDDEIKTVKIDNISGFSPESIKVYESNKKHSKYCEKAFTLLSPVSLFTIQLAKADEDDENATIKKTENEYELKYFDTQNSNNNIIGTLNMTNYSVPLDFNGINFLWVEFLETGNRNICLVDFSSLTQDKKPNEPNTIELEKDNKEVGHISMAKILSKDRIFIVHSMNKCEIRTIEENYFSIIEDFTHFGEEVYGLDIINCDNTDILINLKGIIKNNSKKNNNSKNNYNDTIDAAQKENYIKTQINPIQINIESNKNNENSLIKQNPKIFTTFDSSNTFIITLDVNGNVNIFENNNETTLFNLYKLSTISKEHKDKQFFSMGFAYYIKTDLHYFCISTDHGCFIIERT